MGRYREARGGACRLRDGERDRVPRVSAMPRALTKVWLTSIVIQGKQGHFE